MFHSKTHGQSYILIVTIKNSRNNMKTNKLTALFCLLSAVLSAYPDSASAYTLVSGNVSGTWPLSGSPFIVTAPITVPSGQVLTIQPGAVVEIPASTTFTVNGHVIAVGTSSQPITFEPPPTSTDYFSGLVLNYDGGTNVFQYCNFMSSTNPIYMSVNSASMWVQINNCTFSNILSAAVYGTATGSYWWNGQAYGYVYPNIENCVFLSCSNACVFAPYTTSGLRNGYRAWAYGYATPVIENCIFNQLTGAALLMSTPSGNNTAGGSDPIFVNNIIIDAYYGVLTQDPFDIAMENNIFVSNFVATSRSGVLSTTNYYSCFYENTTNFAGYPANYGRPILANNNGTSCDIGFNIFQNPQFVSSTLVQLAPGSPCIDAGDVSPQFDDTSFPPSQGTTVNDQGIYGGPLASNWLIAPVVTWTNSPAITYGTPLSTNQLNVTANVAGSFTCTPPLGTILDSGSNQTVSVVFTPTQTSPYYYYTTVTTNVSLNVLPAPLTIKATNQSKIYGQTIPFTGTEFIPIGLVNGDTVTSASIASAGSPPTALVSGSSFPITITNAVGDAGLTNYNITYVSGSLTVTPALLTVTADPKSRAYGAANPALTYTITGYQNGENAPSANVTGTPVLSTAAAANSSVAGSPYTINCGVGTLAAPNYSFTAANGQLTVTAAPLIVTADSKSRAYGAANPALTYTITGYQNGENATTANVTGTPTLSTTAAANSSVAGSPYTISCGVGTLAASNYSFTAANGQLTVTRAPLTVTADAKSRAYGAANPALTYTITGYQNGENATTANVTGTPTLSTTAAANSSVAGSPYTISCGVGTLAAPNYSFTAANGQLTVTSAPLIVTADSKSRAYGAANPALTYTITGYQNGENATSANVTGTPTLSTTAAANSSVAGSPYTISCGVGTLAAPNYSFTAANGQLTVTPALLSVAAIPQSKTYGQTVAFGSGSTSFTSTNLQNGETIGSVTLACSGNGGASNAMASVCGPVYTITIGAATGGTFNANNYTITYYPGTLTVNPAALSVVANPQSKTFGQTVVFGSGSTNFSSLGLQNGETIGSVTLACSGGAATAAVGNYTITPSAATGGTFTPCNYSITYGTGLLTVIPLPLMASHSSVAYQSPGTCVVSCTLTYGTNTSLEVLVTEPSLPSGWTLLSASGNGNPEVNSGEIFFAGPFPNPLHFTYAASVPAGQTGTQTIQDTITYWLSGMQSFTNTLAAPNPLAVNYGAYLSLGRQSNAISLTLFGDTGTNYTLQASTNLINWTNVGTITPVGGIIQTNVTNTGNNVFFRTDSSH
jgi:hypothetical protein